MPIIMPVIMPDYKHYKSIGYVYFVTFIARAMPHCVPVFENTKSLTKAPNYKSHEHFISRIGTVLEVIAVLAKSTGYRR